MRKKGRTENKEMTTEEKLAVAGFFLFCFFFKLLFGSLLWLSHAPHG